MANITKDERRVNKAQTLYDSSLENYLQMIETINADIPDICDILHGVAMGRTGTKYDVNARQLAQLKDQLNLWKANVQNPEKVLANINDELKKKYGSQKEPEQDTSSNVPKLAVFRPTSE